MVSPDPQLDEDADPGALVLLRGEEVRQRRMLDAVFLRLAREDGAEEWELPPLLPIAALQRAGFFQAFPHLATLAALLRAESVPVIGALGTAPPPPIGSEDLAPPQHAFATAACYGIYPRLQDRTLPGRLLVTLVADCCRREEHYLAGRRQHAFRMREIVCLGSAAEVSDFLGLWSRRLQDLAAAAGLPCDFAAAGDPFFQPADPRRLVQKLQPNKHELRWRGELAIASVNSHRNFFGGSFAIRDPAGAPVFSGCVAFGLDRWLHACRESFGPGSGGWPAVLRSAGAAQP